MSAREEIRQMIMNDNFRHLRQITENVSLVEVRMPDGRLFEVAVLVNAAGALWPVILDWTEVL